MKNTVKYKVLKFVADNGTITRKELQFAIFRAQGKKGKEAITPRNGYYSDGITLWIKEGFLVQPKKAHFKITSLGKKYVENPQLGLALSKANKYEMLYNNVSDRAKDSFGELNDKSLQIHRLERENDKLRAKLDRVLGRLNFHDEISGIVEAQLDLLESAIVDHFELESDIPTGTQEMDLDKVRVELTNIFNGYVKLNL